MASDDLNAQTVISADGTPIAWYDFGGEGPDLLFAHATSLCSSVWLPLAEHLRSQFRCLGYDMRGHGRSGRPDRGPEGWEWSLYAQDIQAVLRAANATNALGVGHSCGGAAEILLEEAEPGSFQALCLFEPVIFPVDPPAGPDPDRDLAVRARRRRQSFASRRDALETFASRGPFTRLDPRALEAYVDCGFADQDGGAVALRCRPEDEAQVYVMASNHSAYGRLNRVKCPTTVVRGADSSAFSEADTRAVVERLPEGHFIQLEGLTHFGPLEAPERFAALILKAFGKAQ